MFFPVPPPPRLAEGTLSLHPWQPDLATALVEAVHESVASVGRWLPWCHAGYGPAEADAWIAQCGDGWAAGGHFAFAIIEETTGTLLGGTGLNRIDRVNRNANLGYWVRQSRQGQGIAARAAGLATRFGFGQLGLVRIEIVIQPDNQPSLRTAEKLGARFEAVARQRICLHGQARDAAVYGLIPEDLARVPAA
ncbi:GNAT family N-acetyltransferase [Archangium violaceum]|uniref:GNAT family N-acetyltransferase n=1 Tax=Archangium violaceum TaxID=83451 RepID=UPI0036D8AB92